MTQPVGGTRLRMIEMSIYAEVVRCMTALGYLGPGWPGRFPVQVRDESFDNNVKIDPNVVYVSPEPITGQDWEMGSTLEENIQTYYLDIFAESEDVGVLLAGDLRDIVRGKMPSVGRTRAFFDILDYRLATPAKTFTVEVQNVDYQIAKTFTEQVNKFYYVVGFDVYDYYDNEA